MVLLSHMYIDEEIILKTETYLTLINEINQLADQGESSLVLLINRVIRLAHLRGDHEFHDAFSASS